MTVEKPSDPAGRSRGSETSEHPNLVGAELARVLFNPRSLALLGASDDVGKTAGRPLQYLRNAGFAGNIYPINPRRSEVLGQRCWPSLAALPEVPEQVFILTPTESVHAAVRECGEAGVRVATILASGFSETGAAGAELEQQLLDTARAYNLRILGPSSLGIVSPHNGLMLTANAAFAEPDFPRGRLFVASQSGSMIGALVSRGKAKGIGFAGLVSVGGELDLSVGEICAATLDDPNIDGYLLFLESLRQGHKLRAFALEAARRGKPVIAYKLGRSQAAAEMTATHTGALAGEDDVADTFLKDSGIVRVGMLESLLECFPLARRIPLLRPARPPQVGFITTTGGGAAMVVDQLGMRDVIVQLPSEATMARVRAAGITAAPARVLDLTLAGTRYPTMKAALDAYLDAPEFDLVVAVVGSSARFSPQLAVKPILDSAGHLKPLVAMLIPEATEANLALTAAGVPCFRTPEACGDSIAATFARRGFPSARRPRAIPHGANSISIPLSDPLSDRLSDPLGSDPTHFSLDPSAGVNTTPGFVDEAQAYRLLQRLGVAHAPFVTRTLSDTAAKTISSSPLPFNYPVALKVCSDRIAHKTEVGGVILNVANVDELHSAFAQLRRNLNAHAIGLQADTALIQPMCSGLAEVLLGYRNDSQAGPIIMLAAGGIWAEIARDRSVRLAPVDLETAREMIAELRILKTVQGLRGKPKGDLEALAGAICAFSELASQPGLGVVEAEINPMMILPEGQGVLAVDALVSITGALQW